MDQQCAKGIFSHFSQHTSVPTISSIGKSESRCMQCLWTVLFVVSFGMLIYQDHLIIIEYYEYPVKTTVWTETKEVPFPWVTVCSVSPIQSLLMERASAISQGRLEEFDKEFPLDVQENKTLMNILAMKLNQMNTSVEADVMLQAKMKLSFNSLLYSQIGPEMMGHMGLQWEDVVVQCSYSQIDCTKKEYFSRNIDSHFFNCYTFEAWRATGSDWIHFSGDHASLRLVIYSGRKSNIKKSPDNFYLNNGIRVILHSPNTMPCPQDKGYDVLPGTSVILTTKPQSFRRLSHPYGQCKNRVHTSKTNQTYKQTSTECLVMKSLEATAKNCKCRDTIPGQWLTVAYNSTLESCFKVTNLSKSDWENANDSESFQVEWSKKEKCVKKSRSVMSLLQNECPPLCNETIFDTSIHSLKADNADEIWEGARQMMEDNYDRSGHPKKWQNLVKLGLMERSIPDKHGLVHISVKLEDKVAIQIIESPAYSYDQALSDLGGQLGLWIGVSLMALFELIPLSYNLIMLAWNRLKERQRKMPTIVKPIQDKKPNFSMGSIFNDPDKVV